MHARVPVVRRRGDGRGTSGANEKMLRLLGSTKLNVFACSLCRLKSDMGLGIFSLVSETGTGGSTAYLCRLAGTLDSLAHVDLLGSAQFSNTAWSNPTWALRELCFLHTRNKNSE